MYCPRCSAENDQKQKYCRQCGLQLSSVRLALHGGMDEALTKYKAGEWLLAGGSIFLILSVLAAFANIFLFAGPWNYGVIINLLIGLIVTVPMIGSGIVGLRRARRALELKNEPGQLANNYPEKGEPRPSAYPTDRLPSPVARPDSITEGTTRHLTSPERER